MFRDSERPTYRSSSGLADEAAILYLDLESVYGDLEAKTPTHLVAPGIPELHRQPEDCLGFDQDISTLAFGTVHRVARPDTLRESRERIGKLYRRPQRTRYRGRDASPRTTWLPTEARLPLRNTRSVRFIARVGSEHAHGLRSTQGRVRPCHERLPRDDRAPRAMQTPSRRWVARLRWQ